MCGVSPFHEFHFHLVPSVDPIFSNPIGKTILARSLIFHIYTRVENQHLKQKRHIILTNLQNFFSFAKHIGRFVVC